VAWGVNWSGQCNVPLPNEGFVAVAAGDYHGLGLTSDGRVVAWGNNSDGQCNVPWPNTGFVAVAGGFRHSVGLGSDGTIVAWGLNDEGQCDVPESNVRFVALAAGGTHDLAIRRGSQTEVTDPPPSSLAGINLSICPNPFNPRTTIAYEANGSWPIRLAIYDLAGRRIRCLLAGTVEAAGRHEEVWDGRSDAGTLVPSGVYLCRFESGDQISTRKLALLR
jgi:hypothetical protein